jgi:hypothetical protein
MTICFGLHRFRKCSRKEEWWPETGLNRRRRPFQGRALPLSYLALAMRLIRDSQVHPGESLFRTESSGGFKRLDQYSNPGGVRQT